jgi:hypothetical protein
MSSQQFPLKKIIFLGEPRFPHNPLLFNCVYGAYGLMGNNLLSYLIVHMVHMVHMI